MNRHFIPNVPKYFEPHVSDCFLNALSAELLRRKINPNLVLVDYLSFLYDREKGYIGNSYFYQYNDLLLVTEDMLNTQLHFIYQHKPKQYPVDYHENITSLHDKKINILFYTENDSDDAYLRLKELIDADTPVIIAIDLYYMSYHRAFGKEHGFHYIVITGYDEMEGCFELFDKFRHASCDFEGKLPIDEIKLARCVDVPVSNPLIGEYFRAISNLWTEVIIGSDFQISRDDVFAILKESCLRLKGQIEILGNQCGLEMMDLFIKDILLKKAEGLSDKNLFLFKTYFNEAFKKMSRSRKRFNLFIAENNELIPQELITDLSVYLYESVKNWEISANLCYKLAINKNLSIIDSIASQLMKIREVETMFTNKLDAYLANFG